MEEDMKAIKDVTPETRTWRSKVCVLRKLPIQTAKNSTLQFQKLYLGDSAGGSVEATIFASDIDLYKDTLEEKKQYIISNAIVTSVKEQYKKNFLSSPFQWKLNAKTSIMPIEDDNNMKIIFARKFIPYRKFARYIDLKTPIDTICIVIDSLPPRKAGPYSRKGIVYEYAAVDQSLQPFIVTLWNNTIPKDTRDFLDCSSKKPVIALHNFYVSSYHGLSLTTIAISSISTKLNRKKFRNMKKWKKHNTSSMDALIKKDGIYEHQFLLQENQADLTTKIDRIHEANKVGQYTINVQATPPDEDQSFFYTSCEDCAKATNADEGTTFYCYWCETTRLATPGLRFTLNVFDETGNLDVTFFTKQGEEFLGVSTSDLWQKHIKDFKYPSKLTKKLIKNNFIKMTIKSKIFAPRDGTEKICYNVSKIHIIAPISVITTPTAKQPATNADITNKAAPKKRKNKKATTLASESPKNKLRFDDSPLSFDDRDTSKSNEVINQQLTKTVHIPSGTISGDVNKIDSDSDSDLPISALAKKRRDSYGSKANTIAIGEEHISHIKQPTTPATHAKPNTKFVPENAMPAIFSGETSDNTNHNTTRSGRIVKRKKFD